jgi:1-acyl-sn-glycerol-3-phosphate acyltransferase
MTEAEQPKPASAIKELPQRTLSQKIIARILVGMGAAIEKVLTRTTIEGLENLPTQGPVLFIANHFSTYDALMMQVHMPPGSYFVGPGDFKLAMGATWILQQAGIILTNRGAVDRQSLKYMEGVLNSGGMLAIFPEGGTWEKRLEDVKSGAAYLSMTTHASLLPIALGGTYRVWYDIVRFKRPKVTIRIGKLLPPMELSGNRKTRQKELDEASLAMMRVIYDMLPAPDQELYQRFARQHFTGKLEAQGTTLESPSLNGLAEILLKPNLFAPLQNHGKGALQALTKQRGEFVPAASMTLAIQTLKTLFDTQFKGYLEYRLGDEKAESIYAELDQLLSITPKLTIPLRFVGDVFEE